MQVHGTSKRGGWRVLKRGDPGEERSLGARGLQTGAEPRPRGLVGGETRWTREDGSG